MIACDAWARTISLSVIAPTLALMILTLTPSTSIFSRDCLTASKLPVTSVFKTTLISFNPSLIWPNKSSRVIPVRLVSASFSLKLLSSAIALACFSVSKAINLSPAFGVVESPVISTGIEGVARTIFCPKSFFRVLTLPLAVPTTIGSPNLKVPFWISKVTTLPICLSIWLSKTAPVAYLFGLAFNSCISAINKIFSSNSPTPSPVTADILLTKVSPPHSSGVRPASTSPVITLSILASGLSILLIATMIGTFAALAWSIASLVCGLTPSSAATIIITISVTDAPLARISVKASWPGVSINVISLPLHLTWYAPIAWVIPPASPLATLLFLK